jgi:hypothetical protein
MAKVYQLVNIACTSPARIELYTNLNALTTDAGRDLDIPPAAGTTQGLVMDLVLDSFPYTWITQDISGENSDNPMTNIAYISITNITQGVFPVTVTFFYVPVVL